MKVYFTGRHFEVSKAIKDFTTEKLKRMERFVENIMEVHIILAIEKYRHIAEITLKGKNATFSGKKITQDMYASISAVLDKIEKQARRYKEKLMGRKRSSRMPGLAASSLRATGTQNPRIESIEMEKSLPRIVKTETQEAKPMTIEEAILQMDNSKGDFLVFRNFRSRKINVIYRRKNGDFGLIEPES
ncbi:MAG: ribosome-associated translation inhibitor RaiA [Acidobacteriota bacterium]